MGLYEDLKAMRYARAQALGQPAFCVFSNKVLDEIVAQRPSSMAQLLAIRGFGQAKAQQVGAEIIALCSAAGSGPAPPPRLATVAPSAAPASGGAWSAHDDQRLWSSRSQPMGWLRELQSRWSSWALHAPPDAGAALGATVARRGGGAGPDPAAEQSAIISAPTCCAFAWPKPLIARSCAIEEGRWATISSRTLLLKTQKAGWPSACARA